MPIDRLRLKEFTGISLICALCACSPSPSSSPSESDESSTAAPPAFKIAEPQREALDKAKNMAAELEQSQNAARQEIERASE